MAPLPAASSLEAPPTAKPPLLRILAGENYNPAPSRNAVWTVVAVFSFFGVCSLLLAGWMHFVERAEESGGYYSRGKRRVGCGGGRSLRAWCRRQRNRSNSSSSTSSASSSEMFIDPGKTAFPQSKRWHRSSSKDASQTQLLLAAEHCRQDRPENYRTFPSFDDEDVEAGPCDCGSIECTPSRPPVRKAKSDILPGTRRKDMKRSMSSPGRPVKDCRQPEDRPKRWRNGRRKSGNRSKGIPAISNAVLDVVMEEAGTTPER